MRLSAARFGGRSPEVQWSVEPAPAAIRVLFARYSPFSKTWTACGSNWRLMEWKLAPHKAQSGASWGLYRQQPIARRPDVGDHRPQTCKLPTALDLESLKRFGVQRRAAQVSTTPQSGAVPGPLDRIRVAEALAPPLRAF